MSCKSYATCIFFWLTRLLGEASALIGVCSMFRIRVRLANRRAWACANCGDNFYPTAETVFEDTRTPLQLWFYAIYLFCTTRYGVSGKELQRQTA